MDEEEEKPKSRLSEDVIYGIAEQMFFKKPFNKKGLMREIDFTKQNPYTIFMGHCQVHLNAMMAQFAKMRSVVFGKELFSANKKDEITFSKPSNSNDRSDAFSGPYRVTKKMAFGVIEYGKLRVSAVLTRDYLKKTVSANDDDDVHAIKKKPIEIFSTLFLDQNMSEEDISKNCELNIEHLCVYEPADVIEANLLSLLALNSVEIELKSGDAFLGTHPYSDAIFFGCSNQSINNNASFANRTKKITLDFGLSLDSPIEDFASFGAKWQRQAHFLVQSCPSLEQLEFELSIYFTKTFTLEHVLQHIRAIFNAIRQLLEQLDGGSEKLRVSVDFTGTSAEYDSVEALTALDNSTEGDEQLFKLGAPIDEDFFNDYGDDRSAYVARFLEIVDAAGRPHLCKFKVFEETRPPNYYGDNDSSSAYSHDPYYGDWGSADDSDSDMDY